MAYTLKDLTINYAKYYVSNSATASDAQGDLICNMKTVTHTNKGKEKVMDTSDGNFQQNLLSNRTLPIVFPKMNPRIDNMIAPIGGGCQIL